MHQDMHLLSKMVESRLIANPRLTLQEVARCIGTDRHYIEGSIRAHYGFAFRELKKRVRLKIAFALLTEEQPNRYVKEIANAVGETTNAFSRFIRSMTGHSATELRRPKW